MNFKIVMVVCVMVVLNSCVKLEKKNQDEKVEPPVVEAQVEVPVETEPAPVIYTLNKVLLMDEPHNIVADEVHLGPGARIYTGPNALNIKTKKFFAESGARVQTFPDEKLVAAFRTSAVDGGVFRLQTEFAEGHLQIFMNGQQGGAAYAGWTLNGDMSQGCQPRSGHRSGQSGFAFIEADQATRFFVTSSMQVAASGPIGIIYQNYMHFYYGEKKLQHDIDSEVNWVRCKEVPKPGDAGQVGQICLRLSVNEAPRCETFNN